MAKKHPTKRMSVGRGGFRKAIRAVLLAKHEDPQAFETARKTLGNRCIYCGVSGGKEHLQPDHLWPESQGRCTVLGNVVPSCPTCNSERRDQHWQEFLTTSPRVQANRNQREQRAMIAKIRAYMRGHGQAQPPSLEGALTQEELELIKDVNLLLEALSDGALAKIGHEKRANVKFRDPVGLFNQLVEAARAATEEG